MAERPIWRGQLRLALVSCPVALYSVRQPGESLHFHFINPDTGNRVRMVTQDAETDEELSRRSLRRGFEFKKDHYVLLDDDDFERARIDSSSVLTVEKFVPGDAIDPVYYDSSYYLVPDGTERNRADDVFVVLRAAIAKTRRVALSRLVIARRERAVALMPLGKGIVLHTLHDMREIAAPDTLFEEIPDAAPDKEMVSLAVKLIDRQTATFDPADMEDRYEARLRDVIEAKLKGEDLSVPEEEEDRGNVVDLMAALRNSLGGKKEPTKAATRKTKTATPARKKSGCKQTRRKSA
ncbi:Ku protein [Acetobacteraceae bacterium KSS8]|uniref:Non-homologous end joining protein Ku n=1 Tax=Endosaccharibacter trunci TaxID=2812733 RepID=A0ABT1W5R9_9PROT|nr:Ku protein [Acetobacteraceae bacterium KSS8]